MSPEELLVRLDEPRPIPAELRRRLEDAVLGAESRTSLPSAGLLRSIDVPRPLPARVEARARAALVRDARSWRSWHMPALALATAAAVLAVAVVVMREPGAGSGRRPPVVAGAPQDGGDQLPAAGSPADVPTSSDRTASRPPASVSVQGDRTAAVRTGETPWRIAVAGGDATQEAGFRSHMAQLNERGGVGGSLVEIVDRSATNAVATVNLGPTALATPDGPPAWVSGALLETLATPGDVLKGRVFSLASPVERQAHELAASVFPDDAPSALAVVYHGVSGIFADRIPQALRAVLDRRGVRVLEVPYRQGDVVPLVPASAVFLSLDQPSTLSFLDYAKANGYRLPATVACVFPMLDNAIVGRLDDGYLVLAPYSLGSHDDAAALARATGRPVSAGTIHGWATAKALAAALRTAAATPSGVLDALRRIEGLEHGFAPAYRVRSGTNARVPEGVLYEVRRGAFVQRGGFITDPF